MNENNLNSIRSRLDTELKDITFKESCKDRVRQDIHKPQSRLRALMEREIIIPVRPFAAALFIVAAGVIYALAASLTVSSHDIEKSKIILIENSEGGGQDNVFKD
jgi:hypothetical protein